MPVMPSETAKKLVALLQKLAAKYDLTPRERKAVDAALAEAGEALREKRGRPRGSSVDVAEARRLRKTGLTLAEIGERFGTSKQTVASAMKRADDRGE